MATSDERREVAARLRMLDVEISSRDTLERAVDKFMKSVCGSTRFSPIRYSVRNLCGLANILADLIDPQERTCENVSEKDFEFACSNCHAYTDSPNSYRVEIGYKSGLHNNLNYCPYCGARVTDGGDSR